MRIALDLDDTYTRDPKFWDEVIKLAHSRGHEVTCVTMRHEHEGSDGIPVRVIYTGRNFKRKFCDDIDEQFHIWIDDSPEFIVGDL